LDDLEYRWKGLFPNAGHFIEKGVKISKLTGRRKNFLARPITKITLEKATIKQLKSLGTYRKEFDPLIKIYAGLLFQYTKYEKEHSERDYEVAEIYVNKAGAENYRKIPLVNVMETLRKDILTYSDRLMLNPKSLGEIIAQETDSSIIDIMNKLGGKR
jgi:hypothetical protein